MLNAANIYLYGFILPKCKYIYRSFANNQPIRTLRGNFLQICPQIWLLSGLVDSRIPGFLQDRPLPYLEFGVLGWELSCCLGRSTIMKTSLSPTSRLIWPPTSPPPPYNIIIQEGATNLPTPSLHHYNIGGGRI